MERFNTVSVMEQIYEEISDRQLYQRELHYTTYYYRKMIQRLSNRELIIIFGAGKFGQSILESLQMEGINSVKYFCDNNSKTTGSYVQGLEVLAPQEATERYPNACYVISPIDYENEILGQLLNLNIKIDNIVIFNTKNTGMAVE